MADEDIKTDFIEKIAEQTEDEIARAIDFYFKDKGGAWDEELISEKCQLVHYGDGSMNFEIDGRTMVNFGQFITDINIERDVVESLFAREITRMYA